jgi:hypothetical protein
MTEVDPVRHRGDRRAAIARPVLSVLQMPDDRVAFELICRIACLSDRIKRFARFMRQARALRLAIRPQQAVRTGIVDLGRAVTGRRVAGRIQVGQHNRP